jgi:hypothetical protein
MDLMHKYFMPSAIIKDPLSQLLNRKWEKFLEDILTSLGRIMEIGKMEMAILLFSLSEMILILSNLDVRRNKWKFVMLQII